MFADAPQMSLLLWMNMVPSLGLVVERLDESTLGLLFGMMIIVGRLKDTVRGPKVWPCVCWTCTVKRLPEYGVPWLGMGWLLLRNSGPQWHHKGFQMAPAPACTAGGNVSPPARLLCRACLN